MFSYGSLKLFVIKLFFGLLLAILSGLTIFAFIRIGSPLNGFTEIPLRGSYNNILEYNSVYFAYIFLLFFGTSSYLIFFFTFISGVKLFLGIKSQHFVIKISLLIIFIFISNLLFLLSFPNLSGLIGNFIGSLLPEYFFRMLENIYINFFVLFLLSVMCFLILLKTLGIKIKKFNQFIVNVLKRLLGLFFVLNFLKKKSLSLKNINNTNKSKKSIKIDKKEPTLIKRTVSNKVFNKNTHNAEKQQTSKYMLPPIDLLKTSKEQKKSYKEIEKKILNLQKNLNKYLKNMEWKARLLTLNMVQWLLYMNFFLRLA